MTGDMSEVILRPPRYQDIERVAVVHVRSWQAGYRGLLPADFLDGLDPAWRARQRRESWNHPDHAHVRSMIAERDGEVIGFVNHGPCQTNPGAGNTTVTPATGGEIYALYVHPDHWGTGVGSRLLDAAVADLVSSGLTPVRVWTLRGNSRAVRFYRRRGFVLDDVSQPIRLGPAHTLEATADRLTLRDAPATGTRAGPA
jgi:GNAT superfamily N-acetyltransferase